MTLKARAKAASLRIIDAFVCFVRKLWRPMALCGVATATWVNCVYLPLKTGTPLELEKGAAWIAALGALSWVREWGKSKGAND